MDNYEMPEVQLGDWVYFYAHEGAEPVVALVQKVGKGTVVLWSVSPGYGGVERPSVHHKDDPRLPDQPEWKVYGTWEHKPRDTKVAILSEKVALLEKKVADLEGRKTK
jgi:hypothetical protein